MATTRPVTSLNPAARRPVSLRFLIAAAAALAGALALTLTPLRGVAAPAGCADVEVHNVRPQQGFLMIAAFGDAESFTRNALAQMRLPAGQADMTVQLCGLPPTATQIALTLYQDLDGDGKLGRNLVGMPTEPWGSSGSPGAFGPTWETARVPLDGTAIVVKMSL
jgi:uncharacterized protein (DUF2141 family)